MSIKKELENISVGDRVTIFEMGIPSYIREVVRITKTQILTRARVNSDYKIRWKKSNGKMVGSGPWDSSYIELTTDQHISAIRKANQVYRVKNLWNDIKLQDLNM